MLRTIADCGRVRYQIERVHPHRFIAAQHPHHRIGEIICMPLIKINKIADLLGNDLNLPIPPRREAGEDGHRRVLSYEPLTGFLLECDKLLPEVHALLAQIALALT